MLSPPTVADDLLIQGKFLTNLLYFNRISNFNPTFFQRIRNFASRQRIRNFICNFICFQRMSELAGLLRINELICLRRILPLILYL